MYTINLVFSTTHFTFLVYYICVFMICVLRHKWKCLRSDKTLSIFPTYPPTWYLRFPRDGWDCRTLVTLLLSSNRSGTPKNERSQTRVIFHFTTFCLFTFHGGFHFFNVTLLFCVVYLKFIQVILPLPYLFFYNQRKVHLSVKNEILFVFLRIRCFY